MKNDHLNNKTKSLLDLYLQPAFVICVLVLLIAGAGMSYAINKFDIYFTKENLPIAKPLDKLDDNGLDKYEAVHKSKIKYDEVIKSLGTDQYLQWVLEDTEKSDADPTKVCSLFITYYGVPDNVPHVPDECYMGSGFQRLSSEDTVFTFDDRKIPGRIVHFSKTDQYGFSNDFFVCYFFHVNGEFSANRLQTRKILGKNIFGKYSYFSKVEWKFYNRYSNAGNADKEAVMAASSELLKVIVPKLEQQHWPEWKKRAQSGD